ncbi:MAG TPA: adenylate cyclase regulatory domain-containing protein [Solirubrobacteraceae bacterium]|nr:adenylate cyclase regulatory domain-containing protein [Solirubrobacteraceae bacterium]
MVDFAAEGLLDGLAGSERADRLALLRWLAREGASLEELRAAVAEHRLALLPLERRLGGRYSAREIEESTGLPAGLMLELRRLLGLSQAEPDDVVFSEDDVTQARSIQLFLDAGLDVETLSDLTRVLGEAMARVAGSVAAAFADTFLTPGSSELEVAERFDAEAQRLMPATVPVLAGVFNAHMRESIHRAVLGAQELESGRMPHASTLAICFADMVGFTRLGGQLELAELGSVASRLAALAGDRATEQVRLIKTIGDAAMLVSADPAALVEAALGLVADAEAAELPTLRAGIALGEATFRNGDLFGHPVNLASRVTGAARPGSVLVTQEVRDAAADRFDWSYAGRFRFKGVSGQLPLHRARHSGD